MGIVGRDAAPGQQPATARPRQCPRLGFAAVPAVVPAVVRGGTAHGLRAGRCAGADSRLTAGY